MLIVKKVQYTLKQKRTQIFFSEGKEESSSLTYTCAHVVDAFVLGHRAQRKIYYVIQKNIYITLKKKY